MSLFRRLIMSKRASSHRTYLMSEDFESGVQPALWTDTNLPDFAGTPAILGSFSLHLSANGTWADYVMPVSQNEVYCFFKFRMSALPPGITNIFNFQTAGSVTVLEVDCNATGTITMKHGTTSLTTTGAISANVVYNFWVHYKAGSGANGIGSVGFSTTETETTSGANFVSTSAGTGTAAVGLFDPENTQTGGLLDQYYDKCRLDVIPIGSNPV